MMDRIIEDLRGAKGADLRVGRHRRRRTGIDRHAGRGAMALDLTGRGIVDRVDRVDRADLRVRVALRVGLGWNRVRVDLRGRAGILDLVGGIGRRRGFLGRRTFAGRIGRHRRA
jgi:hypothetical protein